MLSINTVKAMLSMLGENDIMLLWHLPKRPPFSILHLLCVTRVLLQNEGNGWKNKKSILILFSKKNIYFVLIRAFPFEARLCISSHRVTNLFCHHIQRKFMRQKFMRQKSHWVQKTKFYFSCGSRIKRYNYWLNKKKIICGHHQFW